MGTNDNTDKITDNGLTARRVLTQIANSEPVAKMRPDSLWALQVALSAISESRGGTVTIRLPERPGAPLDVEYATRRYA